MRYDTEAAVRAALGIESWRNLSKTTLLRFLEGLPEVDREVALRLVSQIPEIAALARAVLGDAAEASERLFTSNGDSMEMVHQVRMERLASLKVALNHNGLTPAERMRILDDIGDVHARADQKDAENKIFLAEQLDKRMTPAITTILTLVVVTIVAAKAGAKVGLRVGPLFRGLSH